MLPIFSQQKPIMKFWSYARQIVLNYKSFYIYIFLDTHAHVLTNTFTQHACDFVCVYDLVFTNTFLLILPVLFLLGFGYVGKCLDSKKSLAFNCLKIRGFCLWSAKIVENLSFVIWKKVFWKFALPPRLNWIRWSALIFLLGPTINNIGPNNTNLRSIYGI